MSHYFDRNGCPISLREWARKFEDIEGRTIARDRLPDGSELVTMWLGLVDGTIDGARLFGTAVRGSSIEELDTYDSEDEALDGHRRHLAERAERQVRPDSSQTADPKR